MVEYWLHLTIEVTSSNRFLEREPRKLLLKSTVISCCCLGRPIISISLHPRVLPQRLPFYEPRCAKGPQRQGLQPKHRLNVSNPRVLKKRVVNGNQRNARQHNDATGYVDLISNLLLRGHIGFRIGFCEEAERKVRQHNEQRRRRKKVKRSHQPAIADGREQSHPQGGEAGQITSDIVLALISFVREEKPRNGEQNAHKDISRLRAVIVTNRILKSCA
jgi:hypothetical protein